MSKKNHEEIQEIINIIHSYNIEQQDIFIYNTLFKNDVDEIAEMFKMDKTFVSLELKRLQKALYNANHKNPKLWEKAMHDYMWEKIRINTKATLNKLEQIATPFDFPTDTESLLFNSELPEKPKKAQKIFVWLKRYISVAVFALFFLTLSAGTGYAMVKLGIIQITHEKSSDVFLTGIVKELEVIETSYLPQYLPKEYRLSEQIGKPHENNFMQTYYTDDVYLLEFHQYVNSTTIENVSTEKINVSGHDGIYQEDSYEKLIIWSDGTYFYLLKSTNPNLMKKELLKISQSIK